MYRCIYPPFGTSVTWRMISRRHVFLATKDIAIDRHTTTKIALSASIKRTFHSDCPFAAYRGCMHRLYGYSLGNTPRSWLCQWFALAVLLTPLDLLVALFTIPWTGIDRMLSVFLDLGLCRNANEFWCLGVRFFVFPRYVLMMKDVVTCVQVSSRAVIRAHSNDLLRGWEDHTRRNAFLSETGQLHRSVVCFWIVTHINECVCFHSYWLYDVL